MKRLPDFVTALSPISGTLAAFETEQTHLREATEEKNDQLFVSTAEDGLALWEADYALSSAGDAAARRARICTALSGSQTLTVEELKRLAVTVGGADRGEVVEDYDLWRVTLCALFDDRDPQDLSALEETVARRKPAHLEVRVRDSAPPKELVYYGQVATLSAASGCTSNVTLDGLAVIMGYGASVEALDEALTRTTASADFNPQGHHSGGAVGGYAVFGGGYYDRALSNVNAFDAALTRQVPAGLSRPIYRLSDCQSASHVLFGCGIGNDVYTTVDAYDAALTRQTVDALPLARQGAGGGQWGQYGVFAGGNDVYGSTYYTQVDLLDANLTHSAGPSMSVGRHVLSVVGTSKRLFLAGGLTSAESAVVEAMDRDLVLTTAPALPQGSGFLFRGAMNNQAVFCGANLASAVCYDEDLTQTLAQGLSVPRRGGDGCSRMAPAVGPYLLVAAGVSENPWTSHTAVEAYKLI